MKDHVSVPPVKFPKIPLYEGWGRPLRVESDAVAMEIVQGEIPAGLNGAWLRCGPDRQYPSMDGEDIFIDGEGQVHRFSIEDGQVHYRCRWVRTERFLAQERARRALFGRYRNRYTSDPSVRHLSMSTANTTTIWHGDKLFALKEDGLPHEIDADTLGTIGTYDYDGQVKSLTLSAHPKIDVKTHELLTFGYQARGDATDDIVFYVIGPDRKVRNEIWFKMPFACTVHDYGVTDTHVIFPFAPIITDLEVIKAGGPFYRWHPEKEIHFAVVPRNGTARDILWYRGPAQGVGHTMNAFVEGNKLHFDVTAYAGNMFTFFPIAKSGVLDYPPPSVGDGQTPVPPFLTRLSFDLSGRTSEFERRVLLKMPGEMPKMDDRDQGYAYRHGYLIVRPRFDPNRMSNLESAIGHVDHHTGALKIWEPGPNRSVHEPQFVPRSPDSPEGEGWLLVIVNRLDENCNDLVILDAQKIEAGPVATIRVPVKVRVTFHGCWIPLE